MIVGDGPERERLLDEAAALHLNEDVEFTGAVDHREIPELLQSMHIAVAPYPDLDGFYFSPLKVFEYMAAGIPVVASRIGQLDQLIENNVNGLLTRPGDWRELSSAIKTLYESPTLRQQIGKSAREFVVKNHSWETKVKSILGDALAPSNLPISI